MCIFILQKKPCKFCEFCSFEHGLNTAASDMEGNLEQIRQLKDLIEKKDIEILRLNLQICEMESRYNCDGETSDENSEIEEDFKLKCDQCNFSTEHHVGLKIHVSKARKKTVKCDQCNFAFKNETALVRHMKQHQIM